MVFNYIICRPAMINPNFWSENGFNVAALAELSPSGFGSWLDICLLFSQWSPNSVTLSIGQEQQFTFQVRR